MQPATIALDMSDIRRFKRHLALALPELGPSLRMELAARGLGYGTYAGMLTDLKNGPVEFMDISADAGAEFADLIGLDLFEDEIRDILYGFQ
ncbi:hypothetical protein [Thioclava sp. F36-7]|uniref:hypothetical protein n=1 Tax=Thioclava sp. F36-7 TaxID=1915317 RepID=UPI000998CEB1|nr:hypothetical protein [Thioclava sp. F36-7]OOY06955.1 hypothetical protein BMI89_20090 [Thioclava sp. F36-7]